MTLGDDPLDTESVKKPASKKPAEAITSKADLIRKVAGIIKAKGEKPRPTEIVKILEEEGVTVAAARTKLSRLCRLSNSSRPEQGGRRSGDPHGAGVGGNLVGGRPRAG